MQRRRVRPSQSATIGTLAQWCIVIRTSFLSQMKHVSEFSHILGNSDALHLMRVAELQSARNRGMC